MGKQSRQEEQTEPGSDERRKIAQMCLEAEELTVSGGPERAMEALESLAHTYPHHSAPRVSLAKLYRWMASEGHPDGYLERGELPTAVEQARLAVALEHPPELATLELLSDLLHMLAAHEERASFFSSLADRHPDPPTSHKAFCWASEALQCRGAELEAEGKREQANSAYRDSVTMHRRALEAWPEAPISEKLSSYSGESHTVLAYRLTGLADEWVREVELLLASEGGLILPGDVRADYLSYASEVAVEAGLCQKGIILAESALWAKEGGETACRYRLGVISALGALLIAYRAAGDGNARESVAERIEEMLCQWEDGAEEDKNLLPESRLPAGYNLAARAFIEIEDWERAIRTSKRAAELWDFGPNHCLLAACLWAGRRDREGALSALRNAARDTLLSGKGGCRNLRDDFRRSSHFSDVQDDKDFLAAIEMVESEV